METNVMPVIEALTEMREDNTVPRNVKTKIEGIIGLLKDNIETSIKISRALHEMEEISEDANMQSYTRTQIFNVVSLLETVK
jgi:uncharacterized protein (UPF0147 family)